MVIYGEREKNIVENDTSNELYRKWSVVKP